MKYKIDDVLIHKSNSCSKWIITSKDYKYNNNMILSELEIFKYFILKDNYKTYKSQCKLKILLSYIEYYNNDLSPEFIKNDDNYVYYKLDQKDYIKEINIDSLIKCNNSDLIFEAEKIIDKHNNN